MATRPMTWFRAPLLPAWLRRLTGSRPEARDLIRAIDAGGIPLNPMRVNAIARILGLEVSCKASMDDTVRRIREALQRL